MSPLRFILDVHLGRLARHLRMVGIDAEWRDDLEDQTLLDRSRDEFRILLTRDRALAARGDPGRSHWVAATDPALQLREVLERFGAMEAARSGAGFLTRCLECNAKVNSISRELARERIPGEIVDQHEEFFLCRRCERVYWKGSHWDRMKIWLEQTLRQP